MSNTYDENKSNTGHLRQLKNRYPQWPFIVYILVVSIFLEIFIAELFSKPNQGHYNQDIYYVWLEGKRIYEGSNPYSRIVGSDYRTNDKYATYFPVFYLMSTLLHVLGFQSFYNWLIFFRIFSFIFFVAISITFLNMFYKTSAKFTFFAINFWMFNRWTLKILNIVHIEFAPLFFLLLSLNNFSKEKWNKSLVYLSISLALKHMAIFIVPIYCIYGYKHFSNYLKRRIYKDLGVIGSIPLIFSIPFLIWDFKGFMLSLIFSLIRSETGSFDASALDAYFNTENAFVLGMILKLPIYILLISVYILYYFEYFTTNTTFFMVFVVFIDFNTNLFPQYVFWGVPFLILTLFEILETKIKLADFSPVG